MKNWKNTKWNWAFWTLSLPLTIAFAMAMTACGQKNDDVAVGRGARTAGVADGSGSQSTITGFSEQGIKSFVSSFMKPSELGTVGSRDFVFSAALSFNSNDQLVTTNSDGSGASYFQFEISDSHAKAGRELVTGDIPASSGRLTANGNGTYKAVLYFEDDYGVVLLDGTFANGTFTGVLKFKNKRTQDTEYPITSDFVTLGNFQTSASGF